MSEKIKGKIEVLIGPEERQADLKYDPNGPEQRWDLEKIENLLDKSDIVVGINDDVIDKLLMELPRLKEARTYPAVAVFEPPEDAVSETITLTAAQVPPEILPYRDQTLIKAGLPKITELRTEKIQTLGEPGEKKGLFGILNKEKDNTVREVQKDVKVSVNPEIREVLFCLEGQKIGDYHPPFSGKPGRTVTGKPIPANKIAFKKFYAGAGTERRGTEFVALETGFLRVGENWIDIVPFAAHEWDITSDSGGTSFFLNFRPGLDVLPPPDKDSLIRLLDSAEVPEHRRVSTEEIYNAVLQAVKKRTPLVGFPLSAGRDCEIRVDIDPAQIRAVLYLAKSGGNGKPLSFKDIGEALTNSKIPRMDIERIKGEIQKFVKSKDQEVSIVLAEGKPPKRGKDKTLDYKVSLLSPERVTAITEKLFNSPDLLNVLRSSKDFPTMKIDKMALVRKGDPIFGISSGGEGESGVDVYGKKISGIAGNEPNIRFFEGVSFKEGIAYAEMDGILDIAEGDNNSYQFRVRKHRDAEVLVSVSENKMNAFISVKPIEGSGLPISKEYLMDILEQHEIVKGIREDLVLDAVEKSEKGELITDFLIAEGKLPAGNETTLKFLVPITPGQKSSVDIKKNEAFAEIHNYEKDDSLGFNVLGEKIDLGPESGLGIEIGENIRKDAQGEKTILFAEKNGRLLYDGNSLKIRDKLSIQGDVALKTGSVKFPGSVEISGSVLSRVSVMAGENIKVGEVIQDALVSSDGNLWVGKGIKGGRKAVIRASGTMKFAFAEEANLLSVGDIHVGKAIMLCQVKCNGKIKGAGDTKILGGVIKAKEGLEIGSIGSERGAKTVISFGQDYLVENQISVVNGELEKLRAFVEKLDDIMEKLENSQDKSKLLEIRQKKLQALKMIEKKNLRLFLLKEKFEAHFPSEIRVSDIVYPGVLFESHGRSLEISVEKKGIWLVFDPSNGKIVEKAH